MNIVVLAGGTSTEREVSIVTGTGVTNALRSKGHHAILVDAFCGIKNVDWNDPFPEHYSVKDAADYCKSFNDHIEELKAARKDFWGENVLKLCKLADFVFLGLHGANGEDGKVQAALDLAGIKYSGTGYLSSAIAMDKGLTKTLFLAAGVSTPKGLCMKEDGILSSPKEAGLDFPVIVKASHGGSSIGVFYANDQQEYEAAVKEAATFHDDIILEECIIGIEYTAAVVDGQAYPIVEIVPVAGTYDYKNKYTAGATKETCPAPLSEKLTRKIQEEAVKGYHALHLDCYARLDFILTEDEKVYCLEANTLPGMTPTSLIPQEAAVLGMDYPTLCQELIRVSMKKYK